MQTPFWVNFLSVPFVQSMQCARNTASSFPCSASRSLDVAALDVCHQAQVLVWLLPSHLRGSPSALGLHRGTGEAHTEGGWTGADLYTVISKF